VTTDRILLLLAFRDWFISSLFWFLWFSKSKSFDLDKTFSSNQVKLNLFSTKKVLTTQQIKRVFSYDMWNLCFHSPTRSFWTKRKRISWNFSPLEYFPYFVLTNRFNSKKGTYFSRESVECSPCWRKFLVLKEPSLFRKWRS